MVKKKKKKPRIPYKKPEGYPYKRPATHNSKPVFKRKCLSCKNVFDSTNNWAEFCSSDCLHLWQKVNLPPKDSKESQHDNRVQWPDARSTCRP